MNRSGKVVGGLRPIAIVAVVVLAGGVGGCEPQQVDGPRQPRPFDPASLKPTAAVAKVAITADMATTDSDNDGVPDQLKVNCYLFPSRMPGPLPVVGKGSFRFEIYNAATFAGDRKPLIQANYNHEESRQYLVLARGMLNYEFRLPLRQLPTGVRQIHIKARFFPEGGGREADPGGTTATVPSFIVPSPRPAATRPPTTAPETRIIRLTPKRGP